MSKLGVFGAPWYRPQIAAYNTWHPHRLSATQRSARRGMRGRGRIACPYYRSRPRYRRLIRRTRPELKWHDSSYDFGVVAQTQEQASAILSIPQGTDVDERIGRKIALHSMFARFRINLPDTTDATTLSDVIRIMIVHDKQCNGALFTGTDLLTTDNYISFNNLYNKHRFKILMDQRYDLNYDAGGYDGTQEVLANSGQTVERYIRFKYPMVIEYNDTVGSVSERVRNNLVVVCVTANGLATCKFFGRVRYTDV